MTLSVGTGLGPYEVVASIGAGGMGEVFAAKDTRLDRTVAVKVLPEHVASSAEHKERFAREARAISKLNHPHICTLFDVGEQDGVHFLVMEHIEGETLAERLKRGPLKLDSAIDYGAQIAKGLDAAHRAGIVHRDLKPGNVMLTKSGVKLLDFGLARLTGDEPRTDEDDAPTQQRDLTEARTLLGTPQYMAPEQLEGKPVDARADIHAFGAVLYEMLTGRKAFAGESHAGLVSAILTTLPEPPSQVLSTSSRGLDFIVSMCLEKDPDDRWQSAHDIAAALKGLHALPQAVHGTERRSATGVIAAALAGAIVSAVILWNVRPASDVPVPRVVRTTVKLPEGQRPMSAGAPTAISPDGGELVFAAVPVSGSGSKLYRRRLSETAATEIPGTDGFSQPFFSPDGSNLGFVIANQRVLATMPAEGGSTRELTTIPGPLHGVAWDEDDYVWYGSSSGLFRVAASGGEPEQMTRNNSGGAHARPIPLPEGRGILFTTSSGPTRHVIAHRSPASGEVRVLFEGQTAQYLPSGHLIYVVGNEVLAAPFDVVSLALTGPPKVVAPDVRRPEQGHFNVGRDGTVAYLAGEKVSYRIVWVDRTGNETTVLVEPSDALHTMRISPDGSRFTLDMHRDGIWVIDFARTTQTLIERGPGTMPMWTADGTEIVWRRAGNLHIRSSDGTGDVRLLLDRERVQSPLSWTPGGGILAITDIGEAGDRDIALLEDGKVTPFLATSDNEGAAAISPDGRWIAYQSDESGREEIYVQPFPGPGRRVLVSTEGGKEPVWAHDGTELFYRQGTAMLAVPIDASPDFFAGKPVLQFDGPYIADNTGHPSYDVSPDGKRFLMAKRLSEESNEFHVILNLDSELRSERPH